MRRAEDDARPVGDECLGCREAKAAAAAGHEIDPVAQSEIHAVILHQWVQRANALRTTAASLLPDHGVAAATFWVAPPSPMQSPAVPG